MSEQTTECVSCGGTISQTTADRNGGLCSLCSRSVSPSPDARTVTPKRPVSRATVDDLILTRRIRTVLSLLFSNARDKANFRPSQMTEGDIIVYSVLSFRNEIRDGGIIQYLSNESGAWAHQCGPSLRTIGAHQYADIIEASIREFTDAASPSDPTWSNDLEAYRRSNSEAFQLTNRMIWDLQDANKDELQNLLYAYICENRDVFASFNVDA